MKLIINVPDELFDKAVRLAREEMKDYRVHYDRPGWGWTFGSGAQRMMVRGIKGGLSVSMAVFGIDPKAGTAEPSVRPREADSISTNQVKR